MKDTYAAKIVKEILGRLGDNKSIEHALDYMDEEVKIELVSDLEDKVHAVLGTERPRLGRIQDKVTTGVVRYARPKIAIETAVPDEYTVVDDNLGGLTLIFNIHHDAKILHVGYSICKPHENFDKAEGRRIAQEMLDTHHPAVLKIKYDPRESLVENLVSALWGATSGQDHGKLLNDLENPNVRSRIGFLNIAVQSVRYST